MPTYDFQCEKCGLKHELRVPISRREDTFSSCEECGGLTKKCFTPNVNIHIPSHFGMDKGWHLPARGVETGVLNATVKTPQRKSFKETIEPLIQGA